MAEGDAVVEHHRRDHRSLGRQAPPRLLDQAAADRGGRQDDEGDLPRDIREFAGGFDRIQVERGRPAGNQDQVGRPGGRQRRTIGVRRSVDHHQAGPVPLGRGEQLGKPLGMVADHLRIPVAFVAPSSRTRLGVEIDDGRLDPGRRGGHRDMDRERGFACATFLADHCDRLHAYNSTGLLGYMPECLHAGLPTRGLAGIR